METQTVVAYVHAVLATTPARWLTLTTNLPADRLRQPPRPGEWSAIDCLRHLLDTERQVFPIRLRALLAGQDFAAFDPASQGTPATDQSPADLAADFAQLRATSLAELAAVTTADLTRTAIHAELGRVTLSELLHEWAGHDLMHTVQAERALMQPFIDGCGPWRPYFQDHDATARTSNKAGD